MKFVKLLLLFILTSCVEKSNTVFHLKENGNLVTVCNYLKVKDTITMSLSDLVTDFKIVHFENSDEAFFKMYQIAITDKYIAINQGYNPVLLFDHNGKFLNKIGNYGNGPGEYDLIHDMIINEKNETIYLAPFGFSKKILKYKTNGEYMGEIKMKGNLNKACIQVDNNENLAVLHMPFDSDNPQFLALQYDKNGALLKELEPTESLITQTSGTSSTFLAFNNSLVALHNTFDFSFMLPSNDTLYHYNTEENKLYPRFAMDFGHMENPPIHFYNEIPHYYLVNVYDKGIIAVNKDEKKANYLKIKNDYFGNIDAFAMSFVYGWFYQMFEPTQLMDTIEKRLSESNCTPEERLQLKKILVSLNENENNILLIAKLKP